jgi:hypothetical protein
VTADDSTADVELKGLEKLLDRALSKCDATKSDLDTLWTTQIVAMGLSIALVVGLDDVASEAIFRTKGYGLVLDLIMPLVNLYFFMRFGFLSLAFSEARYAAEALSEKFIEAKHLSQYFASQENRVDSSPIKKRVLYSTNSYFEPFYQKSHVALVYAYGIFIPIVFSISHSTSIYLLYRTIEKLGHVYVFLSIFVYLAILVSLYITLYQGLKDVEFSSPKLILFIDVMSLLMTVFLLWILFYYHDRMIIRF